MKLNPKDIKVGSVVKKNRGIRILVAGAFLAAGTMSYQSCEKIADLKVTCSDVDVGPSADASNAGINCNDTDSN